MKRTFLIVVGLVALAGASFAAKKPREWKEGKLLSIAWQTKDMGTFEHASATGGGYAPVIVNGRSVRVERQVQGLMIETGDLDYMFACDLGRRGKPLVVTVKGPIRFAIEKSGNYVLDENGRECKVTLLEKRLTSQRPESK